MFDLGQIVHRNAVWQHVVGTIRKGDLPVVTAGRIPEIVGGWRTKGHQVSLSANYTMEWVIEACDWLTQRNVRFRLGAQWMVEHHGTDVDCILDEYVISIEQDDFDLISLFHLIFA